MICIYQDYSSDSVIFCLVNSSDKYIEKRNVFLDDIDLYKDKYTFVKVDGMSLEEWIEKHQEMTRDLYKNDYVPVTPELPKTCTHEWKQYYGLSETFEYCKKCNIKK